MDNKVVQIGATKPNAPTELSDAIQRTHGRILGTIAICKGLAEQGGADEFLDHGLEETAYALDAIAGELCDALADQGRNLWTGEDAEATSV